MEVNVESIIWAVRNLEKLKLDFEKTHMFRDNAKALTIAIGLMYFVLAKLEENAANEV